MSDSMDSRDRIIAAKTEDPAFAIPILFRIAEDDLETFEIKKQAYEDLLHRLKQIGESKFIKDILFTLKERFLLETSEEKSAKMFIGTIIISRVLPDMCELKIGFCKKLVKWCKSEKHTFAGLRTESNLADFLSNLGELDIQRELLEIGEFEDKLLMLEINLNASILYLALGDVERADKALKLAGAVAAHAAGDIPKKYLIALEIQSGMTSLHLKDFGSTVRQFKWAIDKYFSNSKNLPSQAIYAYKYMLLANLIKPKVKPMSQVLVTFMDVQDRDLKAMLGIFKAYEKGSLSKFKKRMDKYKTELKEDPIVQKHVDDLSIAVIGQNLRVLIESSSELTFNVSKLAETIKSSHDIVVKKLSDMIRNMDLAGRLDEDGKHLIIFIGPKDPRIATAHYKHDLFFATAIFCWLTHNDSDCILEVRNQGNTKSCYGFCFVDLLYAVGYLQTPRIKVKGSEQDFIDCMHHFYPNDENSKSVTALGVGWSCLKVFQYVKSHGLATAIDVPFEGACRTATPTSTHGVCLVRRTLSSIEQIKKVERRIHVKTFLTMSSHDEACDALLRSPIAASIFPCPPSFCRWNPDDGIYTGPTPVEWMAERAKGASLFGSHSVLIVGRGIDDQGRDFYICKNSHGTEFGHRGYIKVARDVCTAFRSVREVTFVGKF